LSVAAVEALSKKVSKIVVPLAVYAVSQGRISVRPSGSPAPKKPKNPFETFGEQNARAEKQITMSEEASSLWENMYHDLSAERPGMLGAICGRAETQTLRLSLLYALLDGAGEIAPVHLRAAMAVWKYCEDSAAYIFGDSVGGALADELLRQLRENGGMSRTQIYNAFARHMTHEKTSAALNLLRDHGLAKREMRTGRGRPVEFWLPV
jgi:hypothetical protein